MKQTARVLARKKRGALVSTPERVKLPFVQARRRHLLMSQGDLSDKSGVSKSTIARVETGKAVGMLTAIKLARALDTTVRALEAEPPKEWFADLWAPRPSGLGWPPRPDGPHKPDDKK